MNISNELDATSSNFELHSDVESNLLFESVNKKKKEIKVTVAIPTYKRPHLLLAALESVKTQTTEFNFEIIIVDNDSEYLFSDFIVRSLKKIKNINIKYYVNSKNIGMYGNWNRCFKLSNAEYITILNDDDMLHEEFIEYTLRHIDDASMIITSHNTFSSESDIKNIQDRYGEDIIHEAKLGDIICGNLANGSLGVLFKKSSAVELGGYSENVFPISDYTFLVKNYFHGSVKVSKRKLSYYRWADNESLKKEVLDGFIFKGYLLCKHLIENSSKNKWVKSISIILIKINYCNSGVQYKIINDQFDYNNSLKKILAKHEEIFIRLIKWNPKLSSLSKRILKILWNS